MLELDQIQNSPSSFFTGLFRDHSDHKKTDTYEDARLRARRHSSSKRAPLVPGTKRHRTPIPSPPPVPYEEADSRAEEPGAFVTMQEEGDANCSCATDVPI